MRRGSFFPRRSATRSSTDSAAWPNDLARADTRPPVARFVQRRSWGSVGSLRRFAPRRWAAFSRFRDAGPACRSIRACSLPRPFSSGDLRPRHAVHHRCSADAPESRMWPIATSGLRSLRGSDRVSTTLSRPTGRSCLGLRPLAGFPDAPAATAMGTPRLAAIAQHPWSRHRGRFAGPWSVRHGPIRSWVCGALPAQMCAGIICSGCIHLHGAV
jgi:hypothetical protein